MPLKVSAIIYWGNSNERAMWAWYAYSNSVKSDELLSFLFYYAHTLETSNAHGNRTGCK